MVSLTVLAASGGMGKTSIAGGVARAAARQGVRVVLVDTDTASRALEGCLGVSERVVYDLGDFLTEDRDVSGVAMPVADKLSLIPAPYAGNTPLTEQALRRLMSAIEREMQAELLVFDTSAATDPMARICARATTPVVVTRTDARAVGATANLAGLLPQWGMKPARMIINGLIPAPGVSDVRDMIDTATIPLLGIIPASSAMEPHLAGEMIDDILARAFSNIAARLVGASIPLLTGVCDCRRAVLAT